MSNAPFKIAFWVMSLAFGLTVLMTGLKPEEIRSALNPDLQIEEEESAEFEISVTNFSPASPDHSWSQPHFPRQQKTAPQSGPRPIQVASADLDGSLGLTDESSPFEPDRLTFAGEMGQPPRPQFPREGEIQILVPDPVAVETYSDRLQPSASDEVAQLKKKVLYLQLASARREIEDFRRSTEQQEAERVEFELKQLREQIGELKNQRLALQESATSYLADQNPIPELEIPESVTPEPMPAAFIEPEEVVEPESTIEVTAGTKENTFSFHFDNADIHEVLETLAARAGWDVVIRSDIEGTFSGKFNNAAPNQAFATIIKLHSFGVSFRGDHVLVRGHRDSRVR